jgi:hypothetical protein
LYCESGRSGRFTIFARRGIVDIASVIRQRPPPMRRFHRSDQFQKLRFAQDTRKSGQRPRDVGPLFVVLVQFRRSGDPD